MRNEDQNNLIYAPLHSVISRLEDSQAWLKDEIDGIYLHLASAGDGPTDAECARHPEYYASRTQAIFPSSCPPNFWRSKNALSNVFNIVMVAIASISLLVGGIGIMNIMLASVIERTREIGVRRAVGARQRDIIRQFIVEAVLISFAGGLLGIAVGFGMSELIGWLAGWSTVVTATSILLAFFVSISVGLVFGIYPALKAARLDPVEAIRYE